MIANMAVRTIASIGRSESCSSEMGGIDATILVPTREGQRLCHSGVRLSTSLAYIGWTEACAIETDVIEATILVPTREDQRTGRAMN